MSLWSRDLAVDLGTNNVLVYVQGRGIVLREPAVVAISAKNGSLLAVGEEAHQMVGRTPGEINAVLPLRDGVIANFEMTESMMAYFIRRALQKRSFVGFAPRAIVCVPHSGTHRVPNATTNDAHGSPPTEAGLPTALSLAAT